MQGDSSPGSFFNKYETVGKNPKVLILGEYPNVFDRKSPTYMDNTAGRFLRDELRSWTDSYTLGYIPEIDNDADVDIQLHEVRNYIKERNFETVILFGRVVYEAMLPVSYWKGESVTKLTKKRPYVEDGVRYATAFHPNFIVKSGERDHPQYGDWKNRVRSLCGDASYEALEVVPWRIVGLDQLQATLFEYMDEPRIGFDYEGTSLSPYSLDFDILGFSLATRQKSVYVSFDREMTQSERLMLSMFLTRKAKSIWTYNVSYESKVTWARITKKLTQFQDAYTLCKIDGSHGRLKDNARKYVEADFWEEAIGEIVDSFDKIFLAMTKARKASEDIYNLLLNGKILEAKKAYQEDTKKFKLFAPIFLHIDTLAEIATFDQIKTGLGKYPKAWAAAPVEMMGEYCCYDSYYTVLLVDKLLPVHEHAYQFYITQSWAASAMESFGLNWNDNVASSHEAYYITEAKDCLFKLINLLDFSVVPIKDKKTNTVTITDLDDENRILAQSIYYDNQKTDAEKLDALKDIFNPLSNLATSQIPFWSVYNSDFVTAVTMLMSLEEGLQAHPNIPNKSIELIDRSDLNKTIANLMSCDWRTFGEIQDSRKVRFAQRGVRELVASLPLKVKEHTGKFSGPVMEWQFRALVKFGNLKVDEPETWPNEFAILYYLRRFKKVIKSRSTYINGKVGRSSVWLSKVTDHNTPPIRTEKYFDVQKKNENAYILKPDERWILDTNFNVNGANTRRWTAAIHVVPAASELREIYERRFPSSLFLHFDYCLHQDTLILMGDGTTSRPLSELIQDHKNKITNTVVTRNMDTGKLEQKNIIDIYQTHFEKELLELDFGNGLVIKCSPQHKFYLTDGSVKEASKLTEVDDVDEARLYLTCPHCDKNMKNVTKDHIRYKHPDIIYQSGKPEYVSELSSFRKAKSQFNKRHSLETRNKMSDSASKIWEENADRKSQVGNLMQTYWNEESNKTRLRIRVKKYWQNSKEVDPKAHSEFFSYTNSCQKEDVRYSYGRTCRFESAKAGSVWCRSSYELKFYQMLDAEPKVKTYHVEPFRIFYEDWNDVKRNYMPDVLVTYVDNSRELIEIKPKWKIAEFKNSGKYHAALLHCHEMGYPFTIISEEDLGL